MNRITFIFILSLNLLSLNAQDFLYEGIIINEDNTPISYVNVVSLKNKVGCVTNEKGFFSIPLESSDSVKVSHLSYISEIVFLKKGLNKIVLKQTAFDLNKITVKGVRDNSRKTSNKEIGYYKSRGKSSYKLGPGNQLATFIENDQKLNGLIKRVKVKIDNKGDCDGEIRIRLISVQKKSFSPCKDLLKKNLLFPIKTIKKRLVVDISKYNLIFPEEGIFVVIEWLYNDSKCDSTKINSHFSISSTLNIDQNLVWLSFMDKKWTKRKTFSNDQNPYFITPKISLDIKY